METLNNTNFSQNDQAEVYSNLSFYFALLASLIIVGLAYAIVPNKLDMQYLQTILLPSILVDCKPEKNENVAYILFLISFPIFYIIINYYIRLKNKFIISSDKFLRNIHIANLVIIFGLFIFTNALKRMYLPVFNIFDNAALSIIFYLAAAAIFITLLNKISQSDKAEKVLNILIIATGIFFIFHTTSVFFVPTMYDYDTHHVEAYLYPIIKLMAGQIPYIDFTSIYGMYPYFYYPFLKIFGFTEMNISIFVMVQVFIIYAIFFYVLYVNCKNKFVALLGFLAIIFTSKYIINGGAGIGALQYLPHRVIFPALIIFMITIYQQTSKIFFKRIIYFAMLIISILAIFWNMDTGVIVYLSFIFFYIFKNLQRYSFDNKLLYIESAKHIFLALFSLFILALLFYILTAYFTGKTIDIKSAFYGISVFRGSGFFMLTLPSPHIWFLHIFVLLLALVKGLTSIKFLNLKNTISNDKSAMYFFFAILGFGLFLYYQGRSHAVVYSLVMWQAALPLTLLCDEYFAEFLTRKKNMNFTFFVTTSKLFFIIFLLLSSSIVTVTLTYKLSENFSKMRDGTYLTPKPMDAIVDSVGRYINENGKTDLIIFNASMVYHRLALPYDLPLPARVDIFFLSDLDKVTNYIEQTDNNVVIDINSDSSYYETLLLHNKTKLEAILNDKFEKPEIANNMMFFKRKH